jgi:hypothetical protein
MGCDVDYQALPDDSPLLEIIGEYAVAKPSEGDGWLISTFISLKGDSQNPGYEGATYGPLVKELIAARPGIELRRFDHSSRCWDCWNWLLSEQRRRGGIVLTDADLGSRIVNGWVQLTRYESVFGWSNWVGWTPSSEAKFVWQELSKIEEENLKEHWNPEVMSDSVYKFRNQWELIWESFNDLRAFYKVVAEHNEGALITFWG